MGSLQGRIYDDEERYESLCEKYGEEPQELYSLHYKWIMQRTLKDTPKTFEEFRIPERIKEIEARIESLEKQIQELSFDLGSQRAELIRLKQQV